MPFFSSLTQRADRSARLIFTTRGACLRMSNLHPPYPIFIGNKKALLYAEDTNESRGTFAEVILYDNYGIKKVAKKQKLERIVDIGANIGSFAVLAALCAPNAQIHAYEPHPKAFSWLSKNLNDLNITIFNQAVSDRDGELKFDAREHTTLSFLSSSGSIVVNAITPSKIFPEQTIDFLKVDCEGAEFEIFKDFNLLKRTKLMAMEYHLTETNTMDVLIDLIKQGGHKVTKQVQHPAAAKEYGLLCSRRFL
jgi:FkbM family methyltransferase